MEYNSCITCGLVYQHKKILLPLLDLNSSTNYKLKSIAFHKYCSSKCRIFDERKIEQIMIDWTLFKILHG